MIVKVAAIQIAPVFLNKQKTWQKLKEKILEAVENQANIITWGETLIPGYPQWLSPSGGAKFNDATQKKMYALYWREAVSLDDPIISEMREISDQKRVMLIGGILEQGTSSVYATIITIAKGQLLGRHRKIKPTYEERLVWADGDAQGLKVYDTPIGKIGSLNCWENWLPLARAALHRLGEVIHIAVWPGSDSLTKDISRFIALEGRSWVISASGLLRSKDMEHLSDEEFPMKEEMMKRSTWQNGGSMIVNPKGTVIAGPMIDDEGILYADLDQDTVIQERQNLDISGHYSRFDIFDFSVKSHSN
ncbi:MAG: carbon-nitrogen hydrolase family protein [Candidatus Heimdallarchaeota archaeon]|nr:carbon-nitrogen hydrolase family protein [Candidatus Heimdallarchaeota archaeon]